MEFGSEVIADPRERLCNRVCACLLRELNYYSSADDKVAKILEDLALVTATDPEFVLQLAFYCREVLNIRTTSNFLLAYAAVHAETKGFLAIYFNKSVRLPSDLAEIVGIVQALRPSAVAGKLHVPKVLQKAVSAKFPEFNVYQLGKYCSEGKRKRQILTKKHNEVKRLEKEAAKLATQLTHSVKEDEGESNSEDEAKEQLRMRRVNRSISRSCSEDEDGEQRKAKEVSSKKPSISFKQIIRLCHLKEPAKSVMSIMGKRYPKDEQAFLSSSLAQSGTFEASLANTRMKIPTPVTWETELSAQGNYASVWEGLVKSRKLPFMAMLRNLRNMILTGVDETTHNLNIARLSNPDEVAKSRLFPFRFLSAFDAIKVDLDLMQVYQEHKELEMPHLVEESKRRTKMRVPFRGMKAPKISHKHKIIRPACLITQEGLARYQEALETAVRIATTINVKPIMGHSVVFCDVSGSMRCPLSKGNGLAESVLCMDAAIMLGLMVRSVCKSVDFKIFSSKPSEDSKGWLPVEISTENILATVELVKQEAEKLGGGTDFPFDYIESMVEERVHIDNMFVFSDMMISTDASAEHLDQRHQTTVKEVLHKYRSAVNPLMKFVTVDLAGHGRRLAGADFNNDFLNVEVTGYSDSILRLVSEMQQSQVEAVKAAAAQLRVDRPNAN
jgi:telomerase protein component 1